MVKKNNGWWSVQDKLPKVNEKFGESEYVLCKPEFYPQVVAWYSKVDGWRVASHLANNNPIKVTHWRELPPDPK